MFGSNGSGKGQFQYPRGVAFDSAQNVYVSEQNRNTHIQVFNSEGEHLQWLGDTKLNCPDDVSIDPNDMVYVCDTNNHRICIFDSNGTLLHLFGTKGNSPRGITIDKNGVIYVSDFNNGCMQVF